jgi:protein O-GlcNAc transferase
MPSAAAPSDRASQLSDHAISLNQAGRRLEAFAVYEQALSLDPKHALAYNNFAVALQAHGDVDGAIHAYEAALQTAPTALPVAVPLNRMRCMLDGARWRDWAQLEWLASRSTNSSSDGDWPWSRLEARAFLVDSSSLLHAAASMEAAAVRASAAASVRWACDAECAVATSASPTGRLRPPLRVVLLSDLDADPSASLLVDVLPRLHRSGHIHLTLFSPSAQAPSAHLESIMRLVPTVWLPSAPSAVDDRGATAELCEAQRALRELSPHILLEAMGYLPGHQLSLLARDCTRSPVQASWLRAFHGSMRASFVDYTTVDSRALLSSRGYTEAIVLLPHQHLANSHATSMPTTVAMLRSMGAPGKRRGRGRGGGGGGAAADGGDGTIIACSLNRINKLDPSMMDVWSSALLRARAPLWVATGAGRWTGRGRRESQRALRAEVSARGLRGSLLLTAARAKSAEAHMGRVRQCALSFDSRRWGAHTTALDALWVGVGILTTPGEALATRASHSLLHSAGVPQLTTRSQRDYSNLASILLHVGQEKGSSALSPRKYLKHTVELPGRNSHPRPRHKPVFIEVQVGNRLQGGGHGHGGAG